MTTHNFYNKQNFPIFVCRYGNWDIYCNQQGECAALAKVEGCRSTHFVDLIFLRNALHIEIPDHLLELMP